MIKFLKSKTAKAAVGLIALAMFVGGAASAQAAITSTLKQGSKGAQVAELQAGLNSMGYANPALVADGSFGMKTKVAVMAYQAAKGLKADGIFGAMSRAAWTGTTTGPTTGLPVGCTTTGGFSPVTGQSCAGGSTAPQTGPVSAALSTDNPASGYIVAGQATADLAHYTFTGNGTVNSVTLTRGGISDQNTLTNVYLYDGVSRLTDGYSFNTNGTITMNNLNLMVNGSRTISVKADVYSLTTSNDIYVTLSTFTSGTSVNTVNLKGNDMVVASGSSLASIALSGSNTVTGTPTVNAGTSSYAVWRQAVQVNTRALWLKAANFRITGSAPSDALANVAFYVDGVKTGNNATMTMSNGSNYLSFNMAAMPVALTTGSHTLEVRADIVKGASYNFTVSLQQASDLMVTDPQVGVNLALGSFTTSTGAQITIGAGSATFIVDPSFSAMTNVTGGASNATIGKFKIHGYGEDVKVTSLPINVWLSSGTTPAGIQNVALYFNGSQVGSQVNFPATTGSGVTVTTPFNNGCAANTGSNAGGTCYTYTFSLGSQLIIPAGADSMLEVRADLRNAAGTNYTAGSISANLSTGTGEGFSSHNSVTTPGVTGTSLAIQTGLLAVAKNTGYANQSVTPNTAGVKIGSFVLQNQSSSEAVRVTSLAVGLTRGDGTTALTNTADVSSCPTVGTCYPALTNFSGLRTSETSGSGSTPVQPQAANTFSVDFTLAAGATKTVDVYADTSSATAGILNVTLAVNALGASSNTSITVAAVQGQAISLSSGTVANPPTLLTASSTTAQYIAAGCDANNVCGATDATKATFNLVSTGGSSTISELKFTITGTNTVTSVRVGNVTAPVVSGVAWLQNLNLMVPNGGAGLTVDAYVTYAPVGTSGITPGTTSVTSLTYVKYTSGGTTGTICASGCSATLAAPVDAPTMIMVGSKPTVAVTAQVTPATGLNIGTVENKIGEITVSADAKGNIKLNDIQFAVSANGFTTNPTYTNARIADGSTTVAGSSCGQGTAAAASQTIFCEFGVGTLVTTTGVANVESNTDFDGYTIAAGTSKTFSLYATVNGANTGTNSATISTSLVAAGFNWDDASTNGAAGSTNLTGSSIYNFPTNSYTIKQ